MSTTVTFAIDGLEEFQEAMEQFLKATDETNVAKVLKQGADLLVQDLLKLPKPRSAIHAAGYTHMVSTFSDRIKYGEVEVGWGKYYGPMVEHGTVNMGAQPHLQPTFNRNAEKYYRKMTDELWKGVKG